MFSAYMGEREALYCTARWDGRRSRPSGLLEALLQFTTDPEARLAKKGPGKEARLCYSANAPMENRNTILLDFQVELADGTAERRATIAMVDADLPGTGRITLAGDHSHDTREFVATCRTLNVRPHGAESGAPKGWLVTGGGDRRDKEGSFA